MQGIKTLCKVLSRFLGWFLARSTFQISYNFERNTHHKKQERGRWRIYGLFRKFLKSFKSGLGTSWSVFKTLSEGREGFRENFQTQNATFGMNSIS